jgi:hypothetical protein
MASSEGILQSAVTRGNDPMTPYSGGPLEHDRVFIGSRDGVRLPELPGSKDQIALAGQVLEGHRSADMEPGGAVPDGRPYAVS